MQKILLAATFFAFATWSGGLNPGTPSTSYAQAPPNQAQPLSQLESASRDPNNPTMALAAHTLRLAQRHQEVSARLAALNCGTDSSAACKCLQDYSGRLMAEGAQYPVEFQSCVMRELPKLAPPSGGPRLPPPQISRILNEVCGKAFTTRELNNPPTCLTGGAGPTPGSAAATATGSAPELQGPLPTLPCYPAVVVDSWRTREGRLVEEMRQLQNRTKANINLIKEHYRDQEQFWEKNEQNTKRVVLAVSAARKLATAPSVAARMLAVLPDLTQMVQQEFEFQGLLQEKEKKALSMVKKAGDFQEAQIAIAKDVYERSRDAIAKEKPTSYSTIGKIISGYIIDEAVEQGFAALRASDEKKRDDEILAVMEMAARHSQRIVGELRLLRARITEMTSKRCAPPS